MAETTPPSAFPPAAETPLDRADFLDATEETVSRQITLIKHCAVIELASCREVVIRYVRALTTVWPTFQAG